MHIELPSQLCTPTIGPGQWCAIFGMYLLCSLHYDVLNCGSGVGKLVKYQVMLRPKTIAVGQYLHRILNTKEFISIVLPVYSFLEIHPLYTVMWLPVFMGIL